VPVAHSTLRCISIAPVDIALPRLVLTYGPFGVEFPSPLKAAVVRLAQSSRVMLTCALID